MVRRHGRILAFALCLAICIGLCIPAMAADYPSDTNSGGITASVTATPDELAAGTDASVTVTVVFSEAIQCSGFNARVSVPAGWSTNGNSVKVTLSNDEAQKAGYNATRNTIAKALTKEYGVNGDEYALVTGFSITYTVTGAAAGEQTVGLTNLEVKKVGLDTAYKWAAATAAVTVSAPPSNAVTLDTAASAAKVKQGESVDVTLTLKTADILAAGTLQFAASDGTNSLTISGIALNTGIAGAVNEGNGKISFGKSGSTGAANLPADTLIATVTFATDSATPTGTYTVSVDVPAGQGLYSAANTLLAPSFGTAAQFEVYGLTSIDVTTQPDKTVYVVGESFDPTGMAVTATYSDGSSEVVPAASYTVDPSGELTTTGTVTVTVTYTDGGVTKTATFTITVNDAPITKGDVDGDGSLTMQDAQELFNYLVGKRTFTDEELSQADVNSDGTVDSADIVPLLNLISQI